MWRPSGRACRSARSNVFFPAPHTSVLSALHVSLGKRGVTCVFRAAGPGMLQNPVILRRGLSPGAMKRGLRVPASIDLSGRHAGPCLLQGRKILHARWCRTCSLQAAAWAAVAAASSQLTCLRLPKAFPEGSTSVTRRFAEHPDELASAQRLQRVGWTNCWSASPCAEASSVSMVTVPGVSARADAEFRHTVRAAGSALDTCTFARSEDPNPWSAPVGPVFLSRAHT